jgi:VWFA-related protein
MRAAPVFVIATLVATIVIGGRAQTPPPGLQATPQTPVFRGRLDVVRVDVTVIENKSGKPVSGLSERDFTISENGVRHTIATFAEESLGDASRDSADLANRRVFLFILNAGDFGPYKQHDATVDFIRRRLRPEDVVGILSLGRLSPMTTDHERIAAIVDRLRRTMPLEYRDLLGMKNIDRWGETPEAQRYADNFMEPGSADTGFFRSAVPLLLSQSQYRQNINDTTLPWHVRLSMHDALKVVAGIEYLRSVSGDKHIVIVTRGFDPPFRLGNEGTGLYLRSAEDDRRLATHANDAGVAVDIIQTTGSDGGTSSVISSETVAGYSGGQFSSLRVASQQLARIDEGTRNGYIIGYVPLKSTLDGKYRDIKVTVNRKDVTVVYRHGYTATAEPEHLDPREVVTRQRLRDAAAGATDLNDIRLDVVAAREDADAKPHMRVAVNIDITTLPLAENAGKWEGDLDMLILCGDRKQEVVCRLDQRMTLSMTQAKYDQARASGVPYSTTIPVSGQATLVKVIVYHFESDRIGVVTMKLK